MCVCVCARMCVCVCVRERERERGREVEHYWNSNSKTGERERERERNSRESNFIRTQTRQLETGKERREPEGRREERWRATVGDGGSGGKRFLEMEREEEHLEGGGGVEWRKRDKRGRGRYAPLGVR